MSNGLCGCFCGSRMLLAGWAGGGCRVSVRDLDRVQLSSLAAPDELLFEQERASGGSVRMRALVQEILNEIRLANWKRKPRAIAMLGADKHANFSVSAPYRPRSEGRGQVSSAKSGLVPLEIVRAKAVESILECRDWELEHELGDYSQPSPQASSIHIREDLDMAYHTERSKLLSSHAQKDHNNGLNIIKNSLAILRSSDTLLRHR
mmetsp:Transcript_31062/g.99664  ORF Transcript_31062/g.99664 Transcript_31062/m.99664 type:complete len:206 (-) Transcript_31062:574-1191(-)